MDNFSWLFPLILAIFAAVSSASKKSKNPSGTRPFNSPPSPWARTSKPGPSGFSKWLTLGESISEPWKEPKQLWVEEEVSQSAEGTIGIEGSQGIEGTSGIEGTPGLEGQRGIEGSFEGEGDYKKLKNLTNSEFLSTQTSELSFNTLPNQEDLLRAVVWAEILGKPKALRAHR